MKPQVQIDSAGHVYRLWVDEWAGQGQHIRFQRSTDGGKTWVPEPALMLDRDKPPRARSTLPVLIQDASGRVTVLWRTKLGGKKDMRVLVSPDGGATWPGPAQTVNRDAQALGGDLATDGDGHVYAVWYDERRQRQGKRALAGRGLDIFFNRSADGGKSWLADDVRLSEPPTGPPAGSARASVSDAAPDNEKDEPDEADTGKVPDGKGQGKGDGKGRGDRRKREPRPPTVLSFHPRIQADRQGRVFVAWLDTREGTARVYIRVSTDHGQTWGPEVNVGGTGKDVIGHQLLTDGQGRLFLVWTDRRDGPEDIYFTRSEDGGQRWDDPVRLTRRRAGATSSRNAHMALGADGRVYVAWEDRRNGREDIYLNASADAGKTWLDRDVRLDRDDAGTGISANPFVVTYGARGVAVLWDDDRSGFEQILMNRSADGGKTWLDREVRVDTRTPSRQRATGPRAAWERAGALHVVWEAWTSWAQQVERHVEYARLPLQP
jgi:hypothetical protein